MTDADNNGAIFILAILLIVIASTCSCAHAPQQEADALLGMPKSEAVIWEGHF
jgi:hypothetical protein